MSATRIWTKVAAVAAVPLALLLVLLTPAGTWARQMLLPTQAAVTGSVHLDGTPASRARLLLDGDNGSATDAAGRFRLTDVGEGAHRLRIEASGARTREFAFTVPSGATTLDVGVVKVEAFLRLGYAATVRKQDDRVKYDVTLWLTGQDDAMRAARKVAYVLPAPLPADRVAATGRDKSFCYRVKGSLPLDDLEVLGGRFTTAIATVELTGGRTVMMTAVPEPGKPVACSAKKGSELADEVDRTRLPSGDEQDERLVPRARPTPRDGSATDPATRPRPRVSSAAKAEIPDVAGLNESTATGRLSRAGLDPQPRARPSDTVPAGKVIGTEPAAGTLVTQGKTVTVLVSSGPEKATPGPVPELAGKSRAQAEAALGDAGFRVGTVTEVESDAPDGAVVSQRPAAGAAADPGSTVDLQISGAQR